MLAVDCGNSRIKWARFAAGAARDRGCADLGEREAAFAALDAALERARGEGIARVLVANVAGPAVARRVTALVTARLGIAPEFVRVEPAAHGIECGYREPVTLGVDRWLALIAARHELTGAFAVVGAGTAVTFDAVATDGRHLGGLILPGIRLMHAALAAHTEQIGEIPPAPAVAAGPDLLGRSTAEAVGHGSRLALAAAVDRALAVVAATLATEPRLLVTGGDGEALAAWLESRAEVRADLVLEGLAVVAGARE